MLPLITELRERLLNFGVPHDTTDTSLTVAAVSSDHYEVDVTIADSEAVVTLGRGWHEHFVVPADSGPVQQLVLLALTEAARLKVTSRGESEHAWTLETRVDGVWGRAGTTGLLFFPFWRRKRQRYLCNRYIPVNALVPLIPEWFVAETGA